MNEHGPEYDALMVQLEAAHARHTAAIQVLREVVAYVKRVGGFMKHEDQQLLWWAEMLIAESKP